MQCLKAKQRLSDTNFELLTSLGLMLAMRATPVMGTGAFVLVNTLHTCTSILTGVTCTLTHICV